MGTDTQVIMQLLSGLVQYSTYTHIASQPWVKSDKVLPETNGQNATIWLKQVSINMMIVSDPDSLLKLGTVEQMEEDTEDPRPAAVERLWAFSCELSRGRSVSSMAWNKKNPVTQTHHCCCTSTSRCLFVFFDAVLQCFCHSCQYCRMVAIKWCSLTISNVKNLNTSVTSVVCHYMWQHSVSEN